MIQNIQKVILFILIFMALMTVTAAPLSAARIEGVNFDDSAILGDARAPLRGKALLRYLVVIKAYVGAFYLKEGVPPKKALEDVPRRLVLHYFHAIPAEDFAEATTEMIRKNVSPDRFTALAPHIRQLNALYEDVKPGDEYTATHIPGTGLELALNDRVLGVVPGAEYSAAFFSIWIGKHPIDKGFRDRLLGK
jgi:hypothetical protein